VAVFGFGIPLRGSLLVLYVLAGLFLLSSLGLGLLVSTFARTQQQAMMGSMFFVILPMMFLSGFIFPIENMPEPVQVITYAMPLRYFFVIIRGLFLKGVGWAELWDEAAALLLIGLVILALSILRFRKTAG
jgi:ABC-2 type transport system permease protein